MSGLGTIINVTGVLLGGIFGKFFGSFLSDQCQDTLNTVCGISVLFIGIGGALEGMLSINGSSVTSGKSMLIIACLVLGAFIGEILDIEGKFEQFGEWLKIKTGNAKDLSFVDGFVTASLTISIGAMAIVGSIEDGIYGDYSILATKAILDLIIIMVMTCSMGKGCVFAAIPVGIFQGAITVLARFIKPIMTASALGNLSLIGSILIFCVGLNLVWGKKVRVANLLPAIVFAVVIAFLPLQNIL
ncbi:MAG: DUF554 domain-containing protein [Clostridia bacterium]|nr:DUF554 domain-containing protein [Lachnospiraceae bacterium]NCC00422.1 DUF554 domain-containing protein [Clostridia bacterium]NCD02621.1 DUF554 domain-containing protein [Clostridia bacterium]